MFCRNSSGRPSTGEVGVAGAARPSCRLEVRKEFMNSSGSVASYSCAQVQHLAGDDVEEGQAAAHAEQRLGPVHAHRGAEAAVELDHRGRADRVGGGRRSSTSTSASDSMSSGSIELSAIMPGLAVLEQPVVVREHVDRHRVDARRPILSRARGQALYCPCFDRRLAEWSHRNPTGQIPASAAPPRSPCATSCVTARNRRRWPSVGRRARAIARSPAAPSRGAPGGHRGGLRRRSAASRAPASLLDALVGAGQAGHPAASCLPGPRPRLGARTPARTLSRPRALRAARAGRPRGSGVDAIATRRRGAGARARGLGAAAIGSARAAAATTGRSAGSRSAPSRACCCTTTRSASTSPSTTTTGPSARRRRRPAGSTCAEVALRAVELARSTVSPDR